MQESKVSLKLGPMVATALRGGAGALALGSAGKTFAGGKKR